jgi:DNA mismatch endonuclease (patch repair protein)
MADVVTPEKRSQMMAGIRGKNTKPEFIVRRGLHRRGLRYRLHVRSLPGQPDLIFPKYRAAILVNGCFWHGHQCSIFKWPSTRAEFWRSKIDGNRRRDERNVRDLIAKGYRVRTVWECETRKSDADLMILLDDLASWIRRDPK